MRPYLRLLRDHRGFSLLWLAQVISLTGDWFNTIALSALVVAYSPGREGIAVSGLLLARYLPALVLSPVAGVLLDRFDRKALLIGSNLLRAVVVLGFLLATQGADWLPLIYALTIIQFCLSAVFEPGQAALLPALLPAAELVKGNTLVSITWSVMLAVGAVLGGVVASAFGANAALLIDALTFLVAGLLIIPIRPRPMPAPAAHSPVERATFADGLRFLRATPAAASALLVKFSNSLGNVDALMTIYATQLFVLGTDGQLSLGILYGVYGVGAFISPLIANRLSDGALRALRRFIWIGLLLNTVGWGILGAAGSLALVCLALFVRSMGGSINWTYSTILIQKTTPNPYLGRVFSLDMAGFYLATVVSTLVHGALVDTFGAQNAPLIALGTGVVSLLPLIGWGWVSRRLAARPAQLVPAGD